MLLRAQEVPNAAWVNHTFMPYGQPNRTRNDIKLHPYTRNQIWLYRQPSSLQEYCDTAQIVNYVQYRRVPPLCPTLSAYLPDALHLGLSRHTCQSCGACCSFRFFCSVPSVPSLTQIRCHP